MRRIVVTLIGVVILLHGAQARADVITSFTSLLDDRGTGFGFPGQSITTPTGGPWDNLTFNWFDSPGANIVGIPIAGGTLFLLSSEYLGTPAALSSSTGVHR